MKTLVTGGLGFIGSNYIRWALDQHPSLEVTNLDKVTYAGNPENLRDIEDDPRYTFVRGDIARREDVEDAIDGCDVIVNFAAESHVDRSIEDPHSFLRTDVVGAHTLLEAARDHDVDRFVQISTDEVYGSIEDGSFTEDSMLDPSSPYSASKTSADLLVGAYVETYGLDALITRSSNNFGPYQYPEKLIPVLISRAIDEEPLPLYGDGENVRDWLYVEDNCRAIHTVLEHGQAGEVYNVGAGNERRNVDIARTVLELLDKPEDLITFVEDRPGHDRRYSVDASKTRDLGWAPRWTMDEAMERTVQWYVDNEDWWRPLLDEDPQEATTAA